MERVLILVKTYPVISSSYVELVCTAGMREDGTWVRIYPVSFRRMNKKSKYEKYQWVSLELKKRDRDFRPESYSPVNLDSIQLGETVDRWEDRWKVIRKSRIFTNMNELVRLSKKENGALSLAVFKPSKIKRFVVRKTESQWPKEKLKKIEQWRKQGTLLDDENDEEIRRTFQVVTKIPYSFSYEFEDDAGTPHRMNIEDWETGRLFLRYWKPGDPEEPAIEKVRAKYEEMSRSEHLHFYLGTVFENHQKGYPNPFSIIGVFAPKRMSNDIQETLF